MIIRLLGFVAVFLFTQYNQAQSFTYRHYGMNNGLSNNKTYDIVSDSTGYIWIATDNGVNKFDGSTFELFDQSSGLNSPSIIELHLDAKDNLWLEGFKTGLQIIKKNDSVITPKIQAEKISQYKSLTSFEDNLYFINASIDRLPYYIKGKYIHQISNIPTTEYLFVSNDHQLLAGCKDGLYRIEDFRATKMNITGIDNKTIYSIAKSGNVIWSGSDDGIIKIIDNRIAATFPTINPVTELSLDHDGGLWFGMKEGGGGYISNKLDNKPIQLLDSSLLVSDIFVDKQNSVWISTYGDGVYQFTNKFILDYSHITPNSNSPALSINKYKRDGVILGFKDHLVVVDQNNNVDEINIPKLFPSGLLYYSNTISVVGQSTVIPAFNVLKNNNLDILFAFGTISYFDSDSIVFASGNGVLYKKLLTTKKQKILSSLVFDKSGKQKVYSITKIKDTLWLATTGPIYKIYNNIIEPLYAFMGIKQLIKDESENLWLASSKGLLKLNSNHKVDTTFFAENQINCAFIKEGEIWVGTNNGLVGFKNGKTIHLTSLQGLPNNNVSCLYYQDKYLWTGTDKGFCKVDVNSIWLKKANPPIKVFFTSIETLADTNLRPFADLNYKSNTDYLKFNFSCINFLKDEQTEHQYILDNQNWIYTNGLSVSTSLLRYGKHSIQLRTRNLNSDWSYSDELNFSINTPFTKTPLFITILILIILASIWLFIYGIKNIKKKKLATIREIINLKHKSLYAMMNPHFIFNSLSSIQYFVTTHQEKDANIYISKLARLIRINLSQTIKNEVSIKEELEFIKLYLELEKVRFREKFNYDIKIVNINEVDLKSIQIPAFLVQPLIENAIVHGILPSNHSGLISILFSYMDPLLTITITDNGIGFMHENKKKHKSIALDILKKRINLRNEKKSDLNNFSIENYSIRGTKAVITLHIK